MHDLVGAYQRVDRLYRLYLKSAFPLRSEVLGRERDELLQVPGVLSQPPLVETVPVYPPSGLTLAAAAKQLPADYRDVAQLADRLVRPGVQLYRHQWESLVEALVNQKDLVVTTGTGSGKTECFLLPLFAQLARESATWPAIGSAPPNRRWWDESVNRDGDRVPQWAHSNRPTALRAVILYPLNALVEDQLRRLRMAVDDDAVHRWLDQHRGGNRITFGRYTGNTPVSGHETPQSRGRLAGLLREAEEQRRKLLAQLQQPGSKLDPDVQYHFPRLDGGEMWSRWDMQATPPDILITNYSMLNIMLMRSIENNVFEATKQWLAEPGHPERQFFLIVDELHAYRGTQGTEVAYILRLLLYRLGLTPESDKLRILTTTASLEDDAKGRGRKFLREFFGRDRFTFIAGAQVPPAPGARSFVSPYQAAFEEFARRAQPEVLAGPPDPGATDVGEAMNQLADRLGAPLGGDAQQRLGEVLNNLKVPDALRDACVQVNREVRPTELQQLDSVLFPAGSTKSQNGRVSDAMRGVLLALGMSSLSSTGRSAQPVRGHLFFHHLQNLWACCNPDCTGVDQSVRRQATTEQRPPVGALHATHRITCSCGSRVLDLIVCEVCGEVFLGGFRAEKESTSTRGKKLLFLTADQPDLEHMPDRVNLEQRHGQYAVFWPLPHDAPWSLTPQDPSWTVDKLPRSWVKAKLDRTTGMLEQGSANTPPPPPGLNEIAGWLYRVGGADAGRANREPAMPTKCPRCDADYARHKTFRSPLRNHRSGFQKACQVLASGLFREMDPGTATRTNRKLVIFADSRQDAAKLAAGMERDHFRDMVRLSLLQAFRGYWLDLVAYLRTTLATLPAAQQMLSSLNPTLFAAVSAPRQPDDVDRARRFQLTLPADIEREAPLWAMNVPALNAQARAQWVALLNEYPNRVPLRDLRDAVQERLLDLGICPGGSGFDAKWYHVGAGRSQRHPWYECFSWSQQKVLRIVNASADQSSHIAALSDMLMGELMYALFPHMARTLEGLGQGWVSYRPFSNPSSDIVNATEAVIRQLGVRRMHRYTSWFTAGSDDNLRAISRNYLNNLGIPPATVQQQLLQADAAISSAFGLTLSPDALTLVPPPDADDAARPSGYRCPQCNAFYLHPVMNCPECERTTALVPGALADDFDYYTELTKPGASCFRMNSEELTGQTDGLVRPKRQRWFQDIFIGSEIERAQGVDLLSVTTTMEAGVDIGGLNVVMMANMPPRRFNYQQRVGRAGRRASGLSLAVTFCRGRSHDDFYYQRPESITGDPPPPPYVDMASEPIYKRVFTKEVLRQAFTAVPSFTPGGGDSVHGEFGLADDWSTYELGIDSWLQSAANQPRIESIAKALCVQTAWADAAAFPAFAAKLLSFLRNDLVPTIRRIATDPAYTQAALSERLANAGLLPMFGFPTRVRLLYTQWPRPNPWPPEEGVVDRDLDLAISQFAPRSQTVKDKAVHTAVGVAEFAPAGKSVTTRDGLYPPLPQGNPRPLGVCDACQAVTWMPSKPLSAPIQSGSTPTNETCPACQQPMLRMLDVREPKGFLTDFDPQDFDGQFEWNPRATRPSLSVSTPPGAVSTSVGNASLVRFSDEILTTNDNGGKGGFDFQSAVIFGQPKPGAYVAMSDPGRFVAGSGPSWRVSLISRRKTDVLLVGIPRWPEGVYADPQTFWGRAAWYSFAFWLGMAAAAHLDVDALELQAGFRSATPIQPGGRVVGEAFLCDQLENGAGYCQFLGDPDEFKELLRQADPNVGDSLAAKWMDTTVLPQAGKPHGAECDTSCNLCLRNFYNLPYHGLLDWRIALDMARLAASPSASVDLTSPWGNVPNPWETLLSGPGAPVPATMQKLLYAPPVQFGKLRGYVHTSPKRPVIQLERHPLWQDDHPDWIAARAVAQSQYPKHTIEPMNPFRIVRRPADAL